MGIVVVFLFTMYLACVIPLLLNMYAAYEKNLKKMLLSLPWKIGFALGTAIYIGFLVSIIQSGKVYAFGEIFTVIYIFGVQPALLGVLASFLPKNKKLAHLPFLIHILTATVCSVLITALFYHMVVANFFDIYKYFNIQIYY